MLRSNLIKLTIILASIWYLIIPIGVFGQNNYQPPATIDTVRYIRLPEIIIYPTKIQRKEYSKIPRQYRKGTRAYNRTIRNLKAVYPYAKLAARKVAEVEANIKKIPNEKKRKAYIKKEYKALMKAYKKPLMNLKISQGKMLVKLIDRETKNTSFEHLKNYKGGFTAFFWQGIARIFTINLKDSYDKEGKDRYLERLIIQYENGEL